MSDTKSNVLVLMGSRAGEHDIICQNENVAHKALALVDKKPIIHYVLEALENSAYINTIFLCCHKSLNIKSQLSKKLHHKIQISHLCQDTPPETILSHIKQSTISFPFLVTTSDHALLTPNIVNDFINESMQNSSDITVGFVNMTNIKTVFPDTKRTYIKCRDGWFSSCNLFLLKNEKSLAALKLWIKLGQYRKNILSLSFQLGILYFLGCFFRFFSLQSAINRLGKKIHVMISPILLKQAQAAIDVDKMTDLELVREYTVTESKTSRVKDDK